MKLKTLSHKLPVKELAKTGVAKAAPKPVVRRQLQGRTRDTKRHELWLEQSGKCAVCERVVFGKGEVHLDHIIPLSQGGDDHDSNLQVLCVPCHEEKSIAELKVEGKTFNGKLY